MTSKSFLVKQKIAWFVNKLLHSQHTYIKNEQDKLSQEQERLSATPNFFYKGEVYVINRLPVNPLHKSLISKFNQISQAEDLLINQQGILISFLAQHKGELYEIIPEYAQHLLTEKGKCIVEPPQHIHDILREHLINEIL